MSMHRLLTVVIALRHAPHSKKSEEKGVNNLAALLGKSSIT